MKTKELDVKIIRQSNKKPKETNQLINQKFNIFDLYIYIFITYL